MKIEFDPDKRAITLARRGLDFADASRMFDGRTVTMADHRLDYGEDRWISFGWLNGRATVVVYTWRGETMRVISMRHAHAEEMEYVGLD